MFKWEECPFVSIKDIDHVINNVLFDYYVLNLYHNFANMSPYSYLHANVIDCVRYINKIIINFIGVFNQMTC
jgi:hypothetical protein